MNDKIYSVVIEALKKMYDGGKITISKINDMYSNKAITKDEYEYIVGKGGA